METKQQQQKKITAKGKHIRSKGITNIKRIKKCA